VTGPLFALVLQPEEPVVLPPNPLSEGDVLLFVVFVLVVAAAFGFDMARTWWETNEWKRDARKRRREQR
jgi:hypothetical protein